MRKFGLFLLLILFVIGCKTTRKRTMPTESEAPTEEKLAGHHANFWQKDTLQVYFMDLEDAVFQNEILSIAASWSQFGNIHFSKTSTSNQADIRLSVRGKGFWSYLGTEATTITALTEPTINLAYLDTISDPILLRGMILHEFGHAIGFIHEHQRPDAPIEWDQQAVRCYFSEFSEQELDKNVLSRYSFEGLNYTPFDTLSVMIYAFDQGATKNHRSAPWNGQLSSTDKLFVGLVYPYE